MEGHITFSNESTVYLKDLYLYPTDPEFDSLGSTEYTGAFIDEISEITEKAKNIVMSRIRFKLEEFGLVPKLLMASNPAKNFAYREYWKPWAEGTLPLFRQFIPALVGDNPFMSPHYAENLKKLDKNSKERLLYGNWHYDDDPSRLFEYDKLNDIFTNARQEGQMYISCDIARFGSDKSVFVIWKGFNIEQIKFTEKKSTKENAKIINSLAQLHHIPRSKIIIDEDGVGGGVVDYMENCVGFVNNSIPIETDFTKKIHNYRNLKTQCYFKLAEVVNNGKIGCYKDIPLEVKEGIIQDLEQIKARTATGSNGQVLNEGKLEVINKKELHDVLGRSTDYSDAMMMRCYFDLDDYYTPYIV